MEQHFVFTNHGQQLLAVLHQPEQRPKVGLVFLHGWPGYRVGAHRLLVKAAREATRRGFAALRFDFRGRGDSEGATLDTTLVTMISDAVVAARELQERAGVEGLAFVGDCSGCEVAIGAGPSTPGLRAMVLWSAPIIGGQRAVAEVAKRRSVYGAYLRKLFSFESWRKLLTGAVRWDLVRRALVRGGKGKGEDGAAEDRDVDWHGSFLAFSGSRLFVYGSADPVTPPCVEFYGALSRRAGTEMELRPVEGANHAFYSAAWEREVIGVTMDWLEACLEDG